MAAQTESSGWENNMKRVAAAVFSRWPLLPRNFSSKISVSRNVTHSRCLLMSGAVHHRYYTDSSRICAALVKISAWLSANMFKIDWETMEPITLHRNQE